MSNKKVNMKLLKDWTMFEKVWLALFTAVNVYLFFAWGDSLLGLVSSMTGMVCVVLVARGKISNYYFGIVQASTYAYISYTYGLYGETMLNALFYLPVQFIGLYMWSKHKTDTSVKGEDIKAKRMNSSGWVTLIGLMFAGTLTYALILDAINGKQVGLDSAAVIMSVTAQILMLKRYAEQWLLWIGVNILSIILWAVALSTTEGSNNYTTLVMFCAFLINSVYGYINWLKISKEKIL